MKSNECISLLIKLGPFAIAFVLVLLAFVFGAAIAGVRALLALRRSSQRHRGPGRSACCPPPCCPGAA